MLKITNDLLSSTLTGTSSLVVALDLSSAFDCVDHGKLLTRLTDDFGICDLAHDWISSYLHGRTQFIQVEEARSQIGDLTVGVPQGSVLGPLLFTAYVAPVSRLISSYGIKHMSYADDFTLYVNLGSDPDDARQRMDNCTSAVSNWFMFNGLQLNAAKSEVIRVGTAAQLRKDGAEGVTVAGITVAEKSSIKLLGVTLDSRLSFEKHVAETCSTASYHIRALRHIRKFIDKPTANTIACSIVG